MYNKSKFLKVSMKSSYPMIVYLRVRRFIGFISGFLKIWLTGLTIFTSFQGRNQIRTNVVVTFQFSNWEFSSLLFTHNYRNSQSESVIMSKVITSKRKKKTEIVHLSVVRYPKKKRWSLGYPFCIWISLKCMQADALRIWISNSNYWKN